MLLCRCSTLIAPNTNIFLIIGIECAPLPDFNTIPLFCDTDTAYN